MVANGNAVLISPHVLTCDDVTISEAVVPPTLDEILSEGGTLFVFIRFEGLGEVIDGDAKPYYFASDLPPGVDSRQWKAWLNDWPDPIPEEVNPFGGVRSASELSFEMIDGDETDKWMMTALLRNDLEPSGYIGGSGSAAQTTITLRPVGTFAEGDLIWHQNEVIILRTLTGSLPGGDTFDCTRAQLGTTAQPFKLNSPVFSAPFYSVNRRVFFGYGAHDGTTYQIRDVSGSWILDRRGLTSSLLGYLIRATSQEKFLDRRIFRVDDRLKERLDDFFGSGASGYNTVWMEIRRIESNRNVDFRAEVRGPQGIPDLWPEAYRFFELDDGEIIAGRCEDPDFPAISSVGDIVRNYVIRGVAGTKVGQADRNETEFQFVQEVYVADADLIDRNQDQIGSFRYAYDAAGMVSEDRTIGFIADDHPIVIGLCMMLSSADPEDGLELVNHNGVWNFSSLPCGVGIGIPAHLIDFDSFIRVWQRTGFLRSPHTVVGRESIPFTEWWNREFGWTRINIRIVDGKWTASFAALPLTTDTETLHLTEKDILVKQTDGVWSSDIEAKEDLESLASSVVYKFKSREGREVTATFDETDFQEVISQSHYYAKIERAIVFEAPGLRLSDTNGSLVLRPLAFGLILRFYKPTWKVRLRVPLHYDSQITAGMIPTLTHALLPENGARGWNQKQVFVVQKNQMIDPNGVYLLIDVLGFSIPGRFGPIAPAFAVTALPGGNVFEGVTARYADPVSASGFPSTDFASFEEGMILMAMNRSGARIGALAHSIIAGGILEGPPASIELDGNFAGAVSAGDVLTLAPYDEARTLDQNGWTAIGSEDGIGANDATLWSYAEF